MELLPSPPYSPNLGSDGYYIFRSMTRFFRGRQFKNVEDVRIGAQALLDTRSKEWCRQRLYELVQTIDCLYVDC